MTPRPKPIRDEAEVAAILAEIRARLFAPAGIDLAVEFDREGDRFTLVGSCETPGTPADRVPADRTSRSLSWEYAGTAMPPAGRDKLVDRAVRSLLVDVVAGYHRLVCGR